MSEPLTTEEIAEIEKRCAATTKFDWIAGALIVRSDRGIIANCPVPQNNGVFECAQNATFIAKAHDDLPRALETIRQYREELDAAHLAAAHATHDMLCAQREIAQYREVIDALAKALQIFTVAGPDNDGNMWLGVMIPTADCAFFYVSQDSVRGETLKGLKTILEEAQARALTAQGGSE